jgi:hypothetical protein
MRYVTAAVYGGYSVRASAPSASLHRAAAG